MTKQALLIRAVRLLREAAQTPIPGTPRLFLPPNLYRTRGQLKNWETEVRRNYARTTDALARRVVSRYGMKLSNEKQQALQKLLSLAAQNADVAALSIPPSVLVPLPGVIPAVFAAGTHAKGKLLGLHQPNVLETVGTLLGKTRG